MRPSPVTDDPEGDRVLPMKRVVLLGSTGSIGTQTLAVLGQFPGHFEIAGLTAGRNMALLAEQILRFGVPRVAVGTREGAIELKAILTRHGAPTLPEIEVGAKGLSTMATLPGMDTLVVG